MTHDLPPVLDVDAAAQLLRCEPTTLEERARLGQLPGLKIGKCWIFPTGALLQRLDELALEEATARRRPIKPSAVLQSISGGRKARRKPPELHSLLARSDK